MKIDEACYLRLRLTHLHLFLSLDGLFQFLWYNVLILQEQRSDLNFKHVDNMAWRDRWTLTHLFVVGPEKRLNALLEFLALILHCHFLLGTEDTGHILFGIHWRSGRSRGVFIARSRLCLKSKMLEYQRKHSIEQLELENVTTCFTS